MEPIRILHVLAAMKRAGTETMLMNLYRNIDRSKVQFDFAVNATEKCDYDEEILQLGGRIFHYPKYRGKNHVSYVRWWNTFFREHGEYRIIHGHAGGTASVYLGIAHKHGRYTIAHSHSTVAQISLYAFLFKISSHSTWYIADYFFGCSREAMVAMYGRRVAADHGRSCILHNAVDAGKFIYNPESRCGIRREFRIGDGDFVVGTIGRLTPPKNPYGTIQIVKALKQRGVRFTFLWVGTGEMLDDIVKKIKEEGLEGEILMIGVRADVEKILQAMDVFILPSSWEGMPVVSVEAQAAGLPTLCSDRISREAGITDLCEFLPPDRPELWADKILAARECERRNTYKEIVESGYDIGSTAAWLQDFYIKKMDELQKGKQVYAVWEKP